MQFFTVLSLIASGSIVAAGPINIYRSSLIPTPPLACITKASNASSTANATALPDLTNSTASAINSTDSFNSTVFSNTTSTTFLDPNDVPDSSNSTALFNSTLSGNSTDLPGSSINPGNSTLAGNSTLGGNSTDLSNSTSGNSSTDGIDASSAGDTTDFDSDSGPSSFANSTSSATSTVSANATSLGLPGTTSTAKQAGVTLPAGGFTLSDTPAIPIPLNAKSVIPRWLRMRVPKFRRIAQADLPDIAQSWQDLCLASGGDIVTTDPCVQLAGVNGINALLANGDVCAQQDNADAMIDFAKSSGVTNSAALIANAIAYRKHPRNALNVGGVVPSTPYCQKAPKNTELKGVVNEQLDSVDPGIFGGPDFPLVAFGEDGTCPFGQTPDVSTCSCD